MHEIGKSSSLNTITATPNPFQFLAHKLWKSNIHLYFANYVRNHDSLLVKTHFDLACITENIFNSIGFLHTKTPHLHVHVRAQLCIKWFVKPVSKERELNRVLKRVVQQSCRIVLYISIVKTDRIKTLLEGIPYNKRVRGVNQTKHLPIHIYNNHYSVAYKQIENTSLG